MKSYLQYTYVIISVIVLCLPNILLTFIGEDSVTATLFKKVVFSFISLIMTVLPLSFIKPKYYSLLVLLISPLILFEASHIIQFKISSTEEAVASIFLTNYHEASELLLSNINLVIIIFLFLILNLSIFLKLKKEFKLKVSYKKAIVITFISIFSAIILRSVLLANKRHDNKEEVVQTTLHSLNIFFRKIFPSSTILRMNDVYLGNQEKKKYYERIKDFRFNSVKKDTITENETYVLLIGETARKHNFSLYGYKRKTTPNLDTIPNLVKFSNPKSNANVTALSIPFMLTRATPKNADLKLQEPPVLQVFKEAGFKTYWLSNQTIGVGSVFGLYANTADVYINTAGSLDSATYDEVLLPKLNDVLEDKQVAKKFIVIHTIGNHFRYNYRYPEHFNYYTPTLQKGLSTEIATSASNKDKLINSYDNSIRYTDYIISNIITRLKKQNDLSYLYFISDHGENLFDDERNKFVHGYNIPTKYEVEIPLFIWYSKEYEKTYIEKIYHLKAHQNALVNTINTFHTLVDLSNISYENEKLEKSIASPKFKEKKKTFFYSMSKKVIELE